MNTIESIKKKGYEVETQLKTEIENISDYILALCQIVLVEKNK